MDTKNQDIVDKYFDLVQNAIKKLISEDKEIKPEQVQMFNDEIFNQDEEIQGQMRQYIDKATMNNLDIERVAKIIYDKFKLQVKNNLFNQKDSQNVPNPMVGERKHIKTFESFNRLLHDKNDEFVDGGLAQYGYLPNFDKVEVDPILPKEKASDKKIYNSHERIIDQLKKKIDEDFEKATDFMRDYKHIHPELNDKPYNKLWSELIKYWHSKNPNTYKSDRDRFMASEF